MRLRCICKGNWRAIIHESEPLFNKIYIDGEGEEYVFSGVMKADDDYYYVLWNPKKTMFLSCVGSIEGYGYTLKTEKNKKIVITKTSVPSWSRKAARNIAITKAVLNGEKFSTVARAHKLSTNVVRTVCHHEIERAMPDAYEEALNDPTNETYRQPSLRWLRKNKKRIIGALKE